MDEILYKDELSRCVRCGACKALCPTYLSALDETMGARGRITMLDALAKNRLSATKGLSDKIFSCMLCEACRDTCPTGINIPEAIYHGRINLKDSYRRGRLLRTAARFSSPRIDTVSPVLRTLQKFLYPLLYKMVGLRYMPDMASTPFKERAQVYPVRKNVLPSKLSNGVYKNTKKIGRVALFVGCSVNYFYPHLGDALLNVLLTKGYEVVILKGEVCCGAPMRSIGLEEDAVKFAKKNIELFNKMRVDAIVSMCPTCTMVIKKQYPLLVGDSIEKIMDINEFFIKYDFISGLKTVRQVITYHDPCHLSYGLGIKNEPREILKGIQGVEFVEMQNAGECCGFGGFFSLDFKELSKMIGKKKMDNIHNTQADTVITSCPGCMMQLEDLKRETHAEINIMHMVELVNEGMQG